MIRIGIVGGTGYTGVELLRLLAQHPEAQVEVITSRAEDGLAVSELFPNLRGHYDLRFCSPDTERLSQLDLVFFATPHGVAQAMMPGFIAAGTRVIDLSADFRLRDIALWERWYGQAHGCPELVAQAVYGLPEVNREKIKHAQLIACPGCYPTSVQLGFLPLLEKNLIDPTRLIANSASGVSGAGRQGKVDLLFAELNDSFKAYGVSGHRHLPEIEQGLRDLQPAGAPAASVTFVPHLLPTVRGIHSTLYATLTSPGLDVQSLFEERFANEPFVDVLPAGQYPQTRSVRGTNLCRIAVSQPQGRDTLVILVAEDNLTKGASGQAIQNMNIMFGLPETLGLNSPALLP
jgi:N-acetyl-gamma-glutamyl-phosphate reductase